jgi:uncharacterized protein YcbK (DUF882 family)
LWGIFYGGKLKLTNTQITKNFKLSEMMCHDSAGTLFLSPGLIDHAIRLQKFRDWYNRPIIVNSWYRTPEYNAQVGGVKNSQHVQGIATDCALPAEFQNFSAARKTEFLTTVKNKWAELCKNDGLGGGVGWYTSFVHLDSRAGSSLAFWDYRGK